jgi:two-component system, chemotaxis family, chemotaxis protein CheV
MCPASPVEGLPGEPQGARRRLLLIALAEAVVALPADPVVEVIPARPYARIPGSSLSVAGVANRRGRMLTVVDLGIALDSAPTAVGDQHRIVVVAYRGRELGLAVKDVLQITSDWWTEEGEEGEGERGDERLRVIELDDLLLPLFAARDHEVGEPTSERS